MITLKDLETILELKLNAATRNLSRIGYTDRCTVRSFLIDDLENLLYDGLPPKTRDKVYEKYGSPTELRTLWFDRLNESLVEDN